MKCVDTTKLKQVVNEYKSLNSKVGQTYKCMWDDPVHDSFSLYNTMVKEYADDLNNICKEIEGISHFALNNNSWISQANHYINEVNSI